MTQLSRYVRVVGCDPGLAHFGWSIVDLYRDRVRYVACGCILTEKSDKKRNVKVADDNVRRARIISNELTEVLDKHKPTHATAEAFSAPRSASAAGKLAMSWGVFIDQLVTRKLGLSTATPQEIKVCLTGKKSASKKEIQHALFLLPGFGRMEDDLELLASVRGEGLPRGKWEHPCDAAGSVVTCLDAEIVIALRGQL